MKTSYRPTVVACFLAYFTQAITINASPLLYVTFRSTFGFSLFQISLLIAINFGTQLLVDALSSKFILRIGYRPATVAAHIFAASGLVGYAVLPFLLPPYAGMLISCVLCGLGGGLIEVMVSPMIEACPVPEEKKSAQMSLLHSFYCWGQAAVILLSTLFFTVFGIAHWRVLIALWGVVPAVGILLFAIVPIYTLPEENGSPFRTLFGNRAFWLLLLMMLSAGASEMVMSQWASSFAETGLGVPKTVGDLLGPFLFALLMGVARLFYARFSEKIRLDRFMTLSLLTCVLSYLIAAFAPFPLLGLLGCGLCGLSVGILWPGTFSTATGVEGLKNGGVTLFALLALAGDVGCLAGPAIAGSIAGFSGGDLRAAFLFALLFPALALGAVRLLKLRKR